MRGKTRHAWNRRAGAARLLSIAARRAALVAVMAGGAAGLTSILVVAGALEFGEYDNPIVVTANITTCTVLVALLACAPLACSSALRRRAAGLDRSSIVVRAVICAIVAVYITVVFWAGPGYAAASVPTTYLRFRMPDDDGASDMFVATGGSAA